MSTERGIWDRRHFLISTAAFGMAPLLSLSKSWGAPPPKKRGIKLGFDNFSIRAFGWKAPQLIDYAASLQVDTLLLSDLDAFESHEDGYLKEIRTAAEARSIELQVGTGSICPTSKSYSQKRWGKAEDHLRLLIRVARAVGSKVARCYLGSRRDRDGEGGIYRHIEETVKVCKAVRKDAEEAAVKVAIENHAGDMQAWELASLIEAAGREYVGATMDPGNATWTMEDPLLNLEILGPHAVTTGIRDSAVWETEKGATVMWANMGTGVVDWPAYVKRFEELCPGVPFVLEILSYTWPREIPYLQPDMWEVFPKARGHEFARFVALAKRGKPFQIPEGRPPGKGSKKLEQAQQKFDLEQSLRYCREALGLGLKD